MAALTIWVVDVWTSIDPVLRGSVCAFAGAFIGVTVGHLVKR